MDPSAPADTETEQSSQADEASQSGSSSSSESEESSSESEAEPESLPSETPVSSRASTPLLPTPRRPGRPPKVGKISRYIDIHLMLTQLHIDAHFRTFTRRLISCLFWC